jgi:hypothetical protein
MDNINNMNIIEQMLEKYAIKTEDDFMNAAKEVFQEIALLGLYRAGFFEKACFYGGTALRLFYGLDRFSEDLIISMTLPDLYAGKMHAVLFRSWGSRVKGRDWYYFEWYVKKGAELNLEHLKERMIISGKWEKKDNFDADIFKNLMMIKIESLDIQSAKKEVKPFIRNQDVLNSWSKEYFKTLTDMVRFKYDRK